MNELLNPMFFLAGIALLGLIFVVLFAGRRKKTAAGAPTPIAPGSKETPVSGLAREPKRHKG